MYEQGYIIIIIILIILILLATRGFVEETRVSLVDRDHPSPKVFHDWLGFDQARVLGACGPVGFVCETRTGLVLVHDLARVIWRRELKDHVRRGCHDVAN
jgi:hypothetical protein